MLVSISAALVVIGYHYRHQTSPPGNAPATGTLAGESSSGIANGKSRLPMPAAVSSPAAVAGIAYLVRTYDCIWPDSAAPLAAGDRLLPGQQIELRSGMVEMAFDCGARVLLQGPASFLIESDRSASLWEGKVTVKAESAEARGFAVRTPSMKTVDLGTEFGLEVAPTGVEQVHVFRGEVEVSTSNHGLSAPPQRLAEKQGIEVDPNTKGVKLVANNGERFVRSLDEAQNKRHVVAWWRFEDHPVGVLVPETQEGKSPIRGSLDSSINGNDLYTWNRGTQPSFSSDVPAETVTRTRDPNIASLDNSRPPGGMATRDLFTNSSWSRPSPVDLQSITPAQWTIEASVKPAKLHKGYQGILVRDGMNVCNADPKLAPFGLQITPKKHFEIKFCDVDGRAHAATSTMTAEENHWYHLAITSNGSELKLYVDSLDGAGYRLKSATRLPSTGSTALARGVWPARTEAHMGHPYIWSLGRGYYGGFVGGWFQGWIDEVRICDVILEPKDFLFASPDKPGGRPILDD
jgi:hypothetical protein